MVVTEQEARDMADAIEAFQLKDSDTAKAINDANIATAQSWFDGVPQIVHPEANTRDEGYANLDEIESLQRTETDQFRLRVLRLERQKAVERIHVIKEGR